jgi:hypothetical protein
MKKNIGCIILLFVSLSFLTAEELNKLEYQLITIAEFIHLPQIYGYIFKNDQHYKAIVRLTYIYKRKLETDVIKYSFEDLDGKAERLFISKKLYLSMEVNQIVIIYFTQPAGRYSGGNPPIVDDIEFITDNISSSALPASQVSNRGNNESLSDSRDYDIKYL